MGKIIHDLQDYRYLKWSKVRHSSGTAGSFLKSYELVHGKKRYYKLSDYDSYKGIVGHECINELIVDRLLTAYGIEHLSYDLIHALITIDGYEYETYMCGSDDYKMPGDSKLSLDVFYQMEKYPNENPMEFCIRYGWDDYIYKMLFIDYLVLNRDRHGANIEIIRSRNNKKVLIAPLFDHGLSLAFSAHSDAELDDFDVNEDRKVQCFVGTGSSFEILELIPKDKMIPLIKTDMREILFTGLENVVSETFINKIWEMLTIRGNNYEDFRLKR